jgi:hypothetical protein
MLFPMLFLLVASTPGQCRPIDENTGTKDLCILFLSGSHTIYDAGSLLFSAFIFIHGVCFLSSYIKT